MRKLNSGKRVRPPAVTMLMSMAAKEKTSSRWTAWLAPILFLLAAVAAAGPASALTCGALQTCAWEKTSAPLESRQSESLQLLNLHQQNESGGYDSALGSPLAAEDAGQAGRPGLAGKIDEIKALPPGTQLTEEQMGALRQNVDALRNSVAKQGCTQDIADRVSNIIRNDPRFSNLTPAQREAYVSEIQQMVKK
jgi:hypothetical protein